MTTVYEMARALGEELKNTPQAEAYTKARTAYESDETTAKEIEEYTQKHQEFQIRQANMTDEEKQSFSDDMQERAEKIRNNTVASDLFQAESQFNELMQSLITMITATFSGQDLEEAGGGCSPSACSGCGGGCH